MNQFFLWLRYSKTTLCFVTFVKLFLLKISLSGQTVGLISFKNVNNRKLAEDREYRISIYFNRPQTSEFADKKSHVRQFSPLFQVTVSTAANTSEANR